MDIYLFLPETCHILVCTVFPQMYSSSLSPLCMNMLTCLEKQNPKDDSYLLIFQAGYQCLISFLQIPQIALLGQLYNLASGHFSVSEEKQISMDHDL